MRSVDHLLADGERIHLVTREHGVVLVGAFVRATVTLAIAGGLAYELAPTRSLGPVPLVVAICAGLVASLALLRLVRRVAVWQGRRLVVTDRKVLLVSGALTRRVTALPLASIDGIEVRRVGALGPRCGALLLSANGRRCVLFGLRRVPHPERVMALMLHLAGEVRERRPRITDAPAHHLQIH
jgi:hypothetical protein